MGYTTPLFYQEEEKKNYGVVLKHNFIFKHHSWFDFTSVAPQWVMAHRLGTSAVISKNEMHCSVSKNSWGCISHFKKQKVFHHGQLKSELAPLFQICCYSFVKLCLQVLWKWDGLRSGRCIAVKRGCSGHSPLCSKSLLVLPYTVTSFHHTRLCFAQLFNINDTSNLIGREVYHKPF